MNTLNSLSSNALVHLIFKYPDGKRVWFCRTDRKRDDQTGQWHTFPIADDDASQSKSMTFEIGLICQRRWRDELGQHWRMALEPYGNFVDEQSSGEVSQWQHIDYFIMTDEVSDTGFLIRAVHTPQGKQFCLKFEHPDLQQQSIFVPFEAGPEACITKAREMHFLDLEPPKPNPLRAEREAEAQRQAQRQAQRDSNTRFGRLRPGDLR
jgi:hypothetical protein